MNSNWIFGQYLANVKIKIINWITIFILIFIDVNNDRRIISVGTTSLRALESSFDNVNYFKPLDTFTFQPVPVHMINVLQLKDGTLLYNNERKIMNSEKKLL